MTIAFSESGWAQYLSWQNHDKKTINRMTLPALKAKLDPQIVRNHHKGAEGEKGKLVI
ncbi:type II toxin-antitoxin system YoeB family toxin [Treponema sp. TIM-1]|uniref:hypothetical protein n=1 Tax=Treponema sp. TIM-1 TaxID=2898417 RepID=UPI0039802548